MTCGSLGHEFHLFSVSHWQEECHHENCALAAWQDVTSKSRAWGQARPKAVGNSYLSHCDSTDARLPDRKESRSRSWLQTSDTLDPQSPSWIKFLLWINGVSHCKRGFQFDIFWWTCNHNPTSFTNPQSWTSLHWETLVPMEILNYWHNQYSLSSSQYSEFKLNLNNPNKRNTKTFPWDNVNWID